MRVLSCTYDCGLELTAEVPPEPGRGSGPTAHKIYKNTILAISTALEVQHQYQCEGFCYQAEQPEVIDHHAVELVP